jgi:hypothetical protein
MASDVTVDVVQNATTLDLQGGIVGAAAVSSFNGRTGAILPATGDYTADQVTPTLTREFVTPAQKEAVDSALQPTGNLAGLASVADVPLQLTI